MNTRTVNKFALMCAASVVALTAAARAQEPSTEAVTVTGSRVISDITLSPTPITAVSADQLQTTTPTTIPDGLNKLPDFIGGGTPRSQGNGSGNGSGNTLNLRNLGASRLSESLCNGGWKEVVAAKEGPFSWENGFLRAAGRRPNCAVGSHDQANAGLDVDLSES